MQPSAQYGNGSVQSTGSRPCVDGHSDEGQTGEALNINDANFDILEWHPAYLSCQRFFIDHAQHEPATQAVCALINIRLPFQRLDHPITSSHTSVSSPTSSAHGSSSLHFSNYAVGGSRGNPSQTAPAFVSLVPYIRRLVVTNFDKPAILHGFFGDDHVKGVLPHVQCERRNYLFAAKHGGWRSCKKQYDIGSGGGGDESVPFMKPLDEAKIEELAAAEKSWSDWLAMEDWMVGPNAPGGSNPSSQGPHIDHIQPMHSEDVEEFRRN